MLEITSRGTNGLFLTVDDDRNIAFEKLVQGGDLNKFLSEKTWEGKKFFNGRRVIAAAESSLATTIPIPLEVARERANATTRITIAELENLIAQAMAKIFNASRGEAAKRLAIDELNAVLVGALAKHFKVDGKTCATPVGLKGKKISLLLELTFTTRAIFEELKPFFNSPKEFFFSEAPQTHLRALSRVRKLPVSLIAAGGEGERGKQGAMLYVLEKPKGEYAVLYREKFDWAFASFITAIGKAFSVNEPAAKQLYCRYHRGEMSETAKRTFKRILAPALQSFLAALEKGKVKGAVYLDLPHPLPIPLPHKHGKAMLAEHPTEELLAELGFTIDRNAPYAATAFGEKKYAVLRPLFYFIEAYFNKDDSVEINQKLRRRLHWLAE